MYTEFYHLKKCPFHITPDPEFLFLSPSHKQALASIIYGVEERKGFIAIVGEVGVGKTTILRSYLESVDKDRMKIIYTFNPNLSFEGVLKLISRELGVENPATDTFEMVDALHHKLIEEYREGRNVVFIIDEAQNMPVETLENLRMLSNLETSKDKLMQIVLIGQPELERVLNQYELRQLKQRIAIYSTISPLTEAESFEYIKFRLIQASSVKVPVFTKGAAQEIVRQAKGIPRSINIIADNALITGFGAQRKPVTTKIVREVVSDLKPRSKPRLRWGFAVFGAVVLIFLTAFLALSQNMLDGFFTAAKVQILKSERQTEPNRHPLAGTAKPSLDSQVKKPGNMDREGQGSLMAKSDRQESAFSPAAEAAPERLVVATGKTEKTGVTEDPVPASDSSKVIDSTGFSDQSNSQSTVNMPGSMTDAGEDVLPLDVSEQSAGSPQEHQPVSYQSNSAATVPHPVERAIPRDRQPTEIRTAKKGDSLIRITAEYYGISVDEVCRRGLIDSVIPLNTHLRDINKIGVGERIFLPSSRVPVKKDKAS